MNFFEELKNKSKPIKTVGIIKSTSEQGSLVNMCLDSLSKLEMTDNEIYNIMKWGCKSGIDAQKDFRKGRDEKEVEIYSLTFMRVYCHMNNLNFGEIDKTVLLNEIKAKTRKDKFVLNEKVLLRSVATTYYKTCSDMLDIRVELAGTFMMPFLRSKEVMLADFTKQFNRAKNNVFTPGERPISLFGFLEPYDPKNKTKIDTYDMGEMKVLIKAMREHFKITNEFEDLLTAITKLNKLYRAMFPIGKLNLNVIDKF